MTVILITLNYRCGRLCRDLTSKTDSTSKHNHLTTIMSKDNIPVDMRKRVEAAVLEIFSSQEFHRVRMQAVAKHAQVSLQTLYKYYGSKEALLYSTLDTAFADLEVRILDHLQAIENFKDRLRKVFWVTLDYFDRNPKIAQILMSSIHLSNWQNDDSFKQRELMDAFLEVIEEGQEEGVLTKEVDEVLLLDFFYGVMFRVILMWNIRGRTEPLSNEANGLFNMLWRAITPAA